ncbi:methylated-DNA--[protein]-cysteine S-methyltransferase [Sphingobium sp. HBC34]|uniref:Methylated-DNA--protein-cysteine methyltransferase n=1 Tax=Sphingobium cyanobacteriorum TaxID=3063954 RepID=A0ABT8ZM05_9SPHN|nr:methylated-DNA--[protein]-cysteine S-methyltransferase [Sphingobium sp. HBC34]MDO7835413.1 methylated-DNA--[protein]-cysteine S-methyltransferase [Sphingobium sp. HBC34]
MTLVQTLFASPVGDLGLIASDHGLVAILWENDDLDRVRLPQRNICDDHPILDQAQTQLAGYFAGTRQHFSLPLDWRGTIFQRRVWAMLLTIPYGETRSYGDIARAIGHPAASRAVGAANGRNPLSIIAPCHRVVGANGALTGFAAGVETKRWLLDFERRIKAYTARSGAEEAGDAGNGVGQGD